MAANRHCLQAQTSIPNALSALSSRNDSRFQKPEAGELGALSPCSPAPVRPPPPLPAALPAGMLAGPARGGAWVAGFGHRVAARLCAGQVQARVRSDCDITARQRTPGREVCSGREFQILPPVAGWLAGLGRETCVAWCPRGSSALTTVTPGWGWPLPACGSPGAGAVRPPPDPLGLQFRAGTGISATSRCS